MRDGTLSDCTGPQPAGQALPAVMTLAEIIHRFEDDFTGRHHPNAFTLHVLRRMRLCKTAAMGGHTYRCASCGHQVISYNSCKNRHCPACQGTDQALWVERQVSHAYPGRHYHLVFTVPHELNTVCQTDSRWYYNHLFACVWDTLHTFGYTRYGVETGAICVLHTWGQNLSLHPHLHCIVPALGQRPPGSMKRIGRQGQYLYPVLQLSATFRGKFLAGLVKYLRKAGSCDPYQSLINSMYAKPWVVFCEPSLASPKHVFQYLGQYIHRVAITNQRILNVSDTAVTFRLRDYSDGGKTKAMTLDGVEFLRRFCLHILPKGFVKIRYFGICSHRSRAAIMENRDKMVIRIPETIAESIRRLTGKDPCLCPACKTGHMVMINVLPRIRAPTWQWDSPSPADKFAETISE